MRRDVKALEAGTIVFPLVVLASEDGTLTLWNEDTNEVYTTPDTSDGYAQPGHGGAWSAYRTPDGLVWELELAWSVDAEIVRAAYARANPE